ncbi:MAG: hypothetical protein ACYDAQ_14245 [Mycobacteriales bacterium]
MNLWLDQVELDPRLLPAEDVLLSSLPAPWTVRAVRASGVLITRSVASADGDEFDNVAALRELEALWGKVGGRGVFTDLFWQQDSRATTTIPASGATFSNDPTPLSQRTAVFNRMADYADTSPLSLAAGPGPVPTRWQPARPRPSTPPARPSGPQWPGALRKSNRHRPLPRPPAGGSQAQWPVRHRCRAALGAGLHRSDPLLPAVGLMSLITVVGLVKKRR